MADLSKIKKGTKVFVAPEKRPYTAKAVNDRFIIMTKPFNPKNTVLYTIVDKKNEVRSTNNLVFNMYDYKVQEDIDECLKDLESGETELSRRNMVKLDIVKIQN